MATIENEVWRGKLFVVKLHNYFLNFTVNKARQPQCKAEKWMWWPVISSFDLFFYCESIILR